MIKAKILKNEFISAHNQALVYTITIALYIDMSFSWFHAKAILGCEMSFGNL